MFSRSSLGKQDLTCTGINFKAFHKPVPQRSFLRYGALRFGAYFEDFSTWKKAGALMCARSFYLLTLRVLTQGLNALRVGSLA